MDRTADPFFDTAPPDAPTPTFRRRVVAKVSAALLPLVKRAARPYLGGDTIEDALCVAARLKESGVAATIGYWDDGSDTLAAVSAVYRQAIGTMTPSEAYLSLKPPALRFSIEAACDLATAAAIHGLRLHCDSHGIEVADRSNAMLEAMCSVLPPKLLGTTLPGRWRRSLVDADWASATHLNVRVVKGQWPDPTAPDSDPGQGFLAVVDRLAGRARRVAVATHDFALGSECIRRLRTAGTPCEIEVLLGYPSKKLLAWAAANAVKVRVYVPYGPGFIPNAIGVLRRNPRLIAKVAEAEFHHLRASVMGRN
jgi:proline dehydrogenase